VVEGRLDQYCHLFHPKLLSPRCVPNGWVPRGLPLSGFLVAALLLSATALVLLAAAASFLSMTALVILAAAASLLPMTALLLSAGVLPAAVVCSSAGGLASQLQLAAEP